MLVPTIYIVVLQRPRISLTFPMAGDILSNVMYI